MMKVSDPIMFGHAVTRVLRRRVREARRDVREARRRAEQRHRRRVHEDPVAAGRSAGGDRGRSRRGVQDAAAARDGRLEQGHHQPARAERRDHRRVDAGRDPLVGPDVGPRRQAPRHHGDDPGPLLRRHLSGGDRRLQEERRVRRADDGQRRERRSRWRRRPRSTARTTRRSRSRRRARVRVVDPQRQGAHRARGRARRHLAHVPDEGPADPRLGEARGRPRARDRPRRDLLARREAAPTTAI